MKYALTIMALVAISEPPPTLPQVAALYQSGVYDLGDFAIWAADYGRQRSVIEFKLLDYQPWMPFPGWLYYDDKSNGTIEITTRFKVTGGKIEPISRVVKSALSTYFTPERIPLTEYGYYVPPVDPVGAIDPNAVIFRTETIIDADPNNAANVALKGLLDIFKDSVKP